MRSLLALASAAWPSWSLTPSWFLRDPRIVFARDNDRQKAVQERDSAAT
jgi:hypothetical protein